MFVCEGISWVFCIHLTNTYLLSSYYVPGNSVKHCVYLDKQKPTPHSTKKEPEEKKKRDNNKKTNTISFTWYALLIFPFWIS